jgi:hypothetical protein
VGRWNSGARLGATVGAGSSRQRSLVAVRRRICSGGRSASYHACAARRFPVETSRASSRSYTVRVRSWPHPTVRGVCAGHLGRRSRTIRQSADPVSVGGRPPRIDAPFGAQPWSRLPGRTAQPPQLTGSCPSTSAFAALAAGLEPAVGNDSDHSDVGLNLRGAGITVLLSKFC